MNLRGFTTSLLVSPYQKFDSIVSVGKKWKRGIPFPFIWRISGRVQGQHTFVKELGLYRQKYCGCVFSEQENTRQRIKAGLCSELPCCVNSMNENVQHIGKFLIITGIIIAVVGGLFLLSGKIPWLGKLRRHRYPEKELHLLFPPCNEHTSEYHHHIHFLAFGEEIATSWESTSCM